MIWVENIFKRIDPYSHFEFQIYDEIHSNKPSINLYQNMVIKNRQEKLLLPSNISGTYKQQELETKLKTQLGETPLALRCSEQALFGILKDKRIKNQFETHTSSAAYNLDIREEAEYHLFNIPLQAPPHKRVIYGFLDQEKRRNQVSVYGRVKIILKSSVAQHTPWTAGDSLDHFCPNYAFHYTPRIPSPILSPSIFSTSVIKPTQDNLLKYREVDYYNEAQFHSSLTVQDIAGIVIYLDQRRSIYDKETYYQELECLKYAIQQQNINVFVCAQYEDGNSSSQREFYDLMPKIKEQF